MLKLEIIEIDCKQKHYQKKVNLAQKHQIYVILGLKIDQKRKKFWPENQNFELTTFRFGGTEIFWLGVGSCEEFWLVVKTWAGFECEILVGGGNLGWGRTDVGVEELSWVWIPKGFKVLWRI